MTVNNIEDQEIANFILASIADLQICKFAPILYNGIA
jgi:hypothetical protein